MRAVHKATEGQGPVWEGVRQEAISRALTDPKSFQAMGPESRTLLLKADEQAWLGKFYEATGKEIGKESLRATRTKVATEKLADILKVSQPEGRETFNVAAGRMKMAIQEAVRKDPYLRDSFPPGTLEMVLNKL